VAFVSEALDARHHLGQFDSGKPELEHWLLRHALDAERRRTARAFVWHDDRDPNVVAYSPQQAVGAAGRFAVVRRFVCSTAFT
jgi:hypothetical protein